MSDQTHQRSGTVAASGVHPAFPHLFMPFELGPVRLRNRIGVSAHHGGWFVDRGLPSDELVAYLEERAKGGIGLFVIGATTPEPWPGCIENVSEAIVPRYAALVEAGHRDGTAVFAQLFHPGCRPLPGPPIVNPPPEAPPTQPAYRAPAPQPLPAQRLRELVEAFGAAAGRAARGGIDGLELHSHESFLHAQMLNPLWNTRGDEYGGPLENRMRFLIETLRAMRAAAGPRMPIGVRLKLDDVEQRGMTAEDYFELVRRLEAGGLVDYLSFTAGDGRFHHGPMPRAEGEWLPLVKQMRARTRLPIMHAGRITTPEMAERSLADNLLDIVCLTKSHICDPHFTRKVFGGRLEDIRYCTRCLQSCHGQLDRMTCVYNPVVSREKTWAGLEPVWRKRRVVIVGAGPAGMEAAVTASARGHEVIVLERADRVGGQIWLGASSPLRRSWARIAEFYARQAGKGVFEVRLGTTATAESVCRMNPDAVVIATGSRSLRLELRGGPAPLTVEQCLQGAVDAARRAVVFDGEGFNRALVAVDYLSDKAVAVEFVTPLLRVAPLAEEMTRDEMIHQFTRRGVRFHPGHSLAGWDAERRLRLRSVRTAEDVSLESIDVLVAAVGSETVNDLAAALRGQVPEVHVIGDANIPQGVEQATYQGGLVGRAL